MSIRIAPLVCLIFTAIFTAISTAPIFTPSISAADPIELNAGPLSMVFEPDNALLRYVRIGEHKLLQGVNAPIRDQYWGTVPPQVHNLKLQREEDSFQISFDVTCREGDIHFFWHGTIKGSPQGKVVFTFDGQARSTFLRNRIGFCVLHGPEAAGRPCVVETVQGELVQGHFPEFIAPHQPFKNIRSITHEISEGVWAKVHMEGDTFEMEDQRNWTDASFKTYCTPLELPFPVKVSEGTEISHRVEISVTGAEKVAAAQPSAEGIAVTVAADQAARQPLPGIGLQVSSRTPQLSDREIERLRALDLDHLRVDVAPVDKTISLQLKNAASQAERLGVSLLVGLHLGENARQELESLRPVLADIRPPAAWLLVSADEAQVSAAREFLERAGQSGRLGQGENANFTELNRERPDPARIDFAAYGVNPQVHAFDNTSMVETLAIQGDTVRSARQFLNDLSLVISPITLKKQALPEPPAEDELPANVDPRQATLFAAGWMAGSLKYLAEAGVQRVTYYETVGWLGIMESEEGTPLPDEFSSAPGQLFPAYHVLRALSDFRGGQVRGTVSEDPMSLVGLALEQGDQRRLILANLTPVEQTATVAGYGSSFAVSRLDQSNLDAAATDTDLLLGFLGRLDADGGNSVAVKLPPYGLAVLEPR